MIWILSPDPEGKCCDCHEARDPCDSCCADPTTGFTGLNPEGAWTVEAYKAVSGGSGAVASTGPTSRTFNFKCSVGGYCDDRLISFLATIDAEGAAGAGTHVNATVSLGPSTRTVDAAVDGGFHQDVTSEPIPLLKSEVMDLSATATITITPTGPPTKLGRLVFRIEVDVGSPIP